VLIQEKEVLLAGESEQIQGFEMLNEMCKARGAKFYVPEKCFMEINGTMIAYTGLLMYSQEILSPLKLRVNPNFRTDDVNIYGLEKKK